jgi:hypothetical protein
MSLGPYRLRAVHLAALWAYGVTQPVLVLIDGNPAFLALRDSTTADALVFALLVAFAPPLAAIAYTRLGAIVSPWVGDMVYLAVLAAFVAPLSLRVAGPIDSRALAVVTVILLSVGAVVCYVRWRAVRTFLSFSIVLPIAGVLWFVQGIPTTEKAHAAPAAVSTVKSRLPVVVVVLDELPLSSLLTRSGRIDRVRYPAFGRLAREATWYPNATTVHEYTDHAVPAMLTGEMPGDEATPTLLDHPQNLFSLLGESYELHVTESVTRLCAEQYCERKRVTLPRRVRTLVDDILLPVFIDTVPRSISGLEEGVIAADRVFNRAAISSVGKLEAFTEDLGRGEASGSLRFVHAVLPHDPWRFLPSGRQYGVTFAEGSHGWSGETPWLVQQGLQRHLLQLQYADVLLGRLLDRLESVGSYDRALVVVVADHGVTISPGHDHRKTSRERFADIASIPLFVKYPGQSRGAVDARAARSVDLLPTIADVLGVRVPWPMDGVSLRAAPPNRDEAVLHLKSRAVLRVPLNVVRAQRDATVRRNTALFGEGLDSLYEIGANRELLGKRVGSGWTVSDSVRVRLRDGDHLLDVRKSSSFVPTRVRGVVTDGTIAPSTELAIAVNGRIQALTRCYERDFQALVPEAALREGTNRVDVFAVEPGATGPVLTWLGSSRGAP